MAENREILAQQAFFAKLDPKYLDIVAGHAHLREFADGELVFRQDDDAKSFFMVLKGQVDVEIPAIYGAPLTVQSLGPGEVLGWSWLIPPFKWHFVARATTDATLLEFDGKGLRELCEQDPKLGYELLKLFAALMSERLQEARMRMLEVCAPPEMV